MSLIKELKDVAYVLNVLYVEYDDDIRNQVKDILNPFFGAMVVAPNGKYSLTYFESNHFDLLITDLTMPVIDGLTTLKHFFEKVTNPHVIIITTHNTSEYLTDSIDFLVDGFLHKPINRSYIN